MTEMHYFSSGAYVSSTFLCHIAYPITFRVLCAADAKPIIGEQILYFEEIIMLQVGNYFFLALLNIQEPG
jgi:hypothetical protein